MRPTLRKLVLVIHLSSSIGWSGAAMAYLALGIWATKAPDPESIRAAWLAMALVGTWAIVPLGLLALATGIVISLGTPWGLFRHYWVVVSLVLTVFANVILIQHMTTVRATADAIVGYDEAQLHGGLGGDLPHTIGGLAVLLAINVLNVFKPQGLTPYGWRRQQEERARRRSTSAAEAR